MFCEQLWLVMDKANPSEDEQCDLAIHVAGCQRCAATIVAYLTDCQSRLGHAEFSRIAAHAQLPHGHDLGGTIQ